MEKVITQELVISPKHRKTYPLDVKLYSGDVNNSYFEFIFMDQDGVKIDLSDGYSVKIVSIFRSNKRTWIGDAEIVDNKAIYRFDTSLITGWDYVDTYIYLEKGGVSADVYSISFKVDLSKVDAIIEDVRQYYIKDIDDVKKEYTGKLEQYLSSLPTAEELKGEAGTIEIGDVVTANAGQRATISNRGTASTAILDFSIPKGDKGDKGDTGEGLNIHHSFTSIEEMNRFDKSRFNQNDNIVINNYGSAENGKMFRYNKVLGIFTEIANISGQRGLKGDKGETGDSVYQSWLKQGNTGDFNTFLQTIKGERGERGLQGQKGEKGDRGEGGRTPILSIDPISKTWLINGADTRVSAVGERGARGEKGSDGRSISVQDSRVDNGGNTVVSFSDGNSILIPRAQIARMETGDVVFNNEQMPYTDRKILFSRPFREIPEININFMFNGNNHNFPQYLLYDVDTSGFRVKTNSKTHSKCIWVARERG